MTPDVNVLVAAFRADHPHHGIARAWLDTAVAAPRTASNRTAIVLLPVVVAGFLRLTTHAKVFKHPDTLADAVAFMDALVSLPVVTYLSQGAPWPLFRKICLDHDVGAPLVTDALIAASVLHQQDILVTFDRDFSRLLPPDSLQLLKFT